MFQTKILEKTHFLCPVTFFFDNRAVYGLMWKNTAKPEKPQMTIWRKCIECWIPKATSTHLEYVILIALPLQQWGCMNAPHLLPGNNTPCYCLYNIVNTGSEAPQLPTQWVPWIFPGDKLVGT
jgi:hypothetical protein